MRGLESRVEKRIEKHRRAQERREREKTANQSRVEKRGDDERREEERIEGMIMKKVVSHPISEGISPVKPHLQMQSLRSVIREQSWVGIGPVRPV